MRVSAAVSETWVRRFHSSSGAAARLVCFPHAGGSASFYHPVSAALTPRVEVLAIQYPGRQDRRAEPPFTDLRALADAAFEALRPRLEGPVALFGHSMGATLAFEVALRMERAAAPPSVLVVSGRRPPCRPRTENVHLRGDDELISEIRRLSGTDSRLLDDPEMISAFLPAMRADYRAIETYAGDPDATVSCPLRVFVGDDDAQVGVDEAAAWQHHATGDFELHVFEGGHFYLTDRAAETIERLAAAVHGAA